ncbi:nucleotidyltransferase domain-containing protein [Catellatospora tritici]|uniref:nucleotidyltransferase domain-containing protein n=1 Tax=Catellatospora tritici TaxID=2851566 RepID=UPI001C2CFC22|nr:aminoglycoside adenylyltransferase [Catellatospora tritici]MBV1852983.1 aminoglycoside adenylyltransferase [Catellatospora tritici]
MPDAPPQAAAAAFRSDVQLAVIGEVVAAAGGAGVPVWLRGGWAMDFYLGEVTRPHLDVDWFCWDSDAEAVRAIVTGLGFTEYGDSPAQRDFLRDEVDLGFALLGRGADGRPVVPSGPYAGAPWPAGMLAGPLGRIGDLTCPVISPQAQIELKLRYPEWNPALARRDKDRADIELLRARLAA